MNRRHVTHASRLAVMAGLFASATVASAGNYVATPGVTFGGEGTGVPQCQTSTITVTETNLVTDLNVGLIIDHLWRLDAQAILTSPSGTSVQIVDGPATNNQIEDYNILLSDDNVPQGGATPPLINSASHGPNDATQPAYQIIVQPNAALSAFDGENPSGDWNLEVCDNFPNFDDGTLDRWELRFADADLEFDLASSVSSITTSTDVTLTLTLDNVGALATTGVTAQLQLPAGFTYVSHSGDGSYNSTTGVWTVGSLAAAGTATLDVVVNVTQGGIASAEVTASNAPDPDSTPGNGVTTEDDYDTASVSFATAPGTPPTLSCSLSATPSVLDWTTGGGSFNWPSPAASELVAGGTISQTYSVPAATKSVDMTISLTGSLDNLIARNLGGVSQQTPVTHPQMTGGSTSGNTDGVILNVDYDSVSDLVTMTVDLGVPGVGMEQVQCPIYDVDLGTWTDRIVARGFLNGQPVSPTYTSSSSNTVGSGGIVGTAGSANTEAGGNMWVTFLQPVDVVEFDYDNIATQTDPSSQVISLENISFCEMPEADITAVKTVETATTDAFMIPGEEVVYSITVTNSASATGAASDVVIKDTLPDNITFLSASATGFTGGSFGSPALPAANTDCTGGACVISFENGTLATGATGEVTIQAVIN